MASLNRQELEEVFESAATIWVKAAPMMSYEDMTIIEKKAARIMDLIEFVIGQLPRPDRIALIDQPEKELNP